MSRSCHSCSFLSKGLWLQDWPFCPRVCSAWRTVSLCNIFHCKQPRNFILGIRCFQYVKRCSPSCRLSPFTKETSFFFSFYIKSMRNRTNLPVYAILGEPGEIPILLFQQSSTCILIIWALRNLFVGFATSSPGRFQECSTRLLCKHLRNMW